MGFGLLFVPLVGGYLFLTSCNLTRFLVRRQSGHHLLFSSACVGLVLLAVARVLEVVAQVEAWSRVVDWAQGEARFSHLSTIAAAFLLGPIAVFATNLLYSKSRGAMRAVHRSRDSMELLFVESMRSDSLVELTLQSGKAYVGWILNASVAEPQRKFVEMLPLASGYRAKKDHKLLFTTNYGPVLTLPLKHPEPTTESDFRVVLPVGEVRSARPFDFATYFAFQEAGAVE